MEQVEPHADHLALHAHQARKGAPRAERILGEELVEGRLAQRLHLLRGAET